MNKPKNKTTLILLLLLYSVICTYAQSNNKPFTLSGIVSSVDTYEKLPGVNVYLKGTTTGTVTNENGYYSLKVQEGNYTIVYSFIGYQTQEKFISLKGDKTLNVTLELNEEMLQEISITSQRKFFGNMDYGRDIPTVKSEEIEKLNSTNASDILHARLAGVWATKTSGAPGDQQKIRIRGQASFFSSAEPLYVIDGVPVPIVNLSSLGIGDLNMHDIESVTVLKDASSTALYGYQGGNGVVLIDTKRRNEHTLNFSLKTGLQVLGKQYDIMNTQDFLSSLQSVSENIDSKMKDVYPEFTESICSHNRQKEIFQPGILSEYQVSGGRKINKVNYYLSGNYSSHKGIIIGTEQKKYLFSTRISTTFKNKLALNINYRWNYQENINNQNEYKGNNLIFQGLSQAPCIECTPESLYKRTSLSFKNRLLTDYYVLNDTITPAYIRNNNNHSLNYFSNAGSIQGRYQVNEHLGFNLIESFMARNSVYSNNSIFTKYYESINVQRKKQVSIESDENIILINHQINLSYNQQFNQHKIGILLANRYYIDNLNWKVDTLSSIIPDHFYLKNSMAGYGLQGSVIRKISSYIIHLNYSYQDKYFASAIANFSQIKEGFYINNQTLFPSLSLSWDLAKEPFLLSQNWINECSFYSNFGISGNFPLIGLANGIIQPPTLYLWNGDPSHFIIKQTTNQYLNNERNTELNFGLKNAFFDHRLKLNGAFYKKRIDNLIILRDIPYYYGGGQTYLNVGNVGVWGLEFGFETELISERNTNWMVQGNFSKSRQKVVKLGDGEDMSFLSDDLMFPTFIIKEGQALGDIYGFKYLGKWTQQDEIAKDIRFINYNGLKFANPDTLNKGLDENDLTIIGNSIPDFNWNLSSSFQYKNFGLDVVIYSSWGVDKYNATRAGTFISGVNRDVLTFYNDSISAIKYPYFYESSHFIDDASFIRLKTLTFRYDPPQKYWGLEFSFSLSFENIITLSRYRGYDPEATIFTDNNFSDNAIDRGAFPNPKSVMIAINVNL
ncbi:MAG: SusC/RagA family TonB-linked outer membrane protein [Prolixibacteraceae bacterium]